MKFRIGRIVLSVQVVTKRWRLFAKEALANLSKNSFIILPLYRFHKSKRKSDGIGSSKEDTPADVAPPRDDSSTRSKNRARAMSERRQ